MGEQNVSDDVDTRAIRNFTKALLDDLRALELMIERGMFETGIRRIGAEQEMFLVDPGCEPAPVSMEVLARLRNPSFTTELARFNLEANLPPYVFGGDCLSRMEADLRALLAKASEAAKECGADVLLTGILPTLRLSDLTLANMAEVPRYFLLNQAMVKLRGGEFRVNLKGIDELYVTHDNVMLEACNTSFQLHFQVGPKEFAPLYNLAQAVTGPVLAAAVNSPMLLEKRLWHETRMALFQQSVDDRSAALRIRGQQPRVRFGEDWVRESVLELFRDDVARFRVVIATDLDENSLDAVAAGRPPKLQALRLHNGTTYRWNRPCYGVADGKAHLRIENRVLPAGPTVIDEMANAAFYYGLMASLADEYPDITKVMAFDDVRGNFLAAARLGLKAQLTWVGGRSMTASELILGQLIPLARAGLKSHGIDSADIDRYLGVLEDRVRSGITGSQWMLDSYNAMKGGTRHERCRALASAILARQKTTRPVHTWERAEAQDAKDWRHSYKTVGQYMTTELFTVRPDDLVELAANVMDWEHIRHVPVEDGEGHLVGLVTHRRLLRELVLRSRSGAERISVREIMRLDPVTAAPDTRTLDVIRLMREHRVGCLPIVKDGRLVGIVTERDLVDVAAMLIEDQLKDFPR